MALAPKENWLAAVRGGRPDYVPRGDEGIVWAFGFEGNFRMDDWTDAWGVDWRVGLEGTVPFPKGSPLPDIAAIGDYRMPNPDRLVFTDDQRRALAGVDRERQVVMGQLIYLLFERAWAITGMDELLMAMRTHPHEVHALLHGIADYTRRVFARYLELGVDMVGGSEDLGTQRALMMSPALFREFLLPEYVYMFQDVLAAGKMVWFHSCGCVDSVAGDLAGIGVTILNPVQARANDLGKVKRATTGRMALEGAIDTAILAEGSPESVRAETIRVLNVLKPAGGYICGPDQGIPGIPEANMAAMWQAARDAGRY